MACPKVSFIRRFHCINYIKDYKQMMCQGSIISGVKTVPLRANLYSQFLLKIMCTLTL